MALIVEDGTGRADSESYVSVSDLDTYATKRGLSLIVSSTEEVEAALRRATAFIDMRYRGRFPGMRLHLRAQALEWPRYGVSDIQGIYVPPSVVPIEIAQATMEGAVRELAEPGILMPDLERGGAVKRLKAGSVEIDYGGSASPNTVFQIIDRILGGLLYAGSNYTATAVRG
jgi:hypothetical protein